MIPVWLKESALSVKQNMPAWLQAYRTVQRDAFLSCGLPDKKHERFKYADFTLLAKRNFSAPALIDTKELRNVIHQHRLQRDDSIMLALVNGRFCSDLSDLHKLPQGVVVCDLHTAITQHEELIKKNGLPDLAAEKYPFATANAALATDGLFLYVPDQCEIDMPIHFLSLTVGEEEFASHLQHVFVFGSNSKTTIAEEHFSLSTQTYFMNHLITMSVGKNAQLTHYKIQHEGKLAIHMANTVITQMQDSSVNYTNFSIGAQFARDDVVVYLQESGSECKTGGFYHLHDDNQYVDHHIDINHNAPRSSSEMLYKGTLDNKSRAVFNGKLHVSKDAQKITAYQENHNILLSGNAEVYSKPELEIYADDVKCKHGATTGQLDQDALFYLCSRGVARIDAVNMLLAGFAEEIIQRVSHVGVKAKVMELI